jgi:hypothetical protein
MVKHIIIWKLREGIDKKAQAALIKSELEGLVGRIDGLRRMCIITDSLPSSSGDVMMDSEFDSCEALSAYQIHPEHKRVATEVVRPFVDIRLSYDYEI